MTTTAPLICLACFANFAVAEARSRPGTDDIPFASLHCPRCDCGDLDAIGRDWLQPDERMH